MAVEGDVNAVALGEGFYSAGREYKDLVCLTYGMGVGGAIVIDRKIYGGSEGVAGEFGHIITHPNGLLCGCGQRGCYEQYASTTALVRACMKVNPRLTNGRIIFEETYNEHSITKDIINNWIDEVILGLITLVHIFNPKRLILGGDVLAQEYVIKEINAKLYDRIMPSYRNVEIRQAMLGNNAGVLGATHLVLSKQ